MSSQEPAMVQNRNTARQAGALYLFLVAVAAYGMGYIPSVIMVPQDIAATSRNILTHESLYRLSMACHLISSTAIALVAMLLYRLFAPVDKHLARLLVVPVIVQLPIVVLLECFHMTTLMILKGDVLTTFDPAQQQEIAHLLLRMHRYGIAIAQLFWGLWLFPFGMLVFRSGFVPTLFGWLLLLNGIGYVTEAFAYVLLQRDDFLLVRGIDRITFIGLPLTMLWLLIRGVRTSKPIPST